MIKPDRKNHMSWGDGDVEHLVTVYRNLFDGKDWTYSKNPNSGVTVKVDVPVTLWEKYEKAKEKLAEIEDKIDTY
jgi:hypothetical protein